MHCQGTQAAEYDKVLYLLPSRGPSTATAPSSEEALPQGTDCGGSRGRGRSSERGGAPWVYQRLVEDLVPMVFSLAPILPQLRSEYRWLLPPSRHLRHFSEDMFGIDLSSRALHLHQAAAAHPIFVRQLLVVSAQGPPPLSPHPLVPCCAPCSPPSHPLPWYKLEYARGFTVPPFTVSLHCVTESASLSPHLCFTT